MAVGSFYQPLWRATTVTLSLVCCVSTSAQTPFTTKVGALAQRPALPLIRLRLSANDPTVDNLMPAESNVISVTPWELEWLRDTATQKAVAGKLSVTVERRLLDGSPARYEVNGDFARDESGRTALRQTGGSNPSKGWLINDYLAAKLTLIAPAQNVALQLPSLGQLLVGGRASNNLNQFFSSSRRTLDARTPRIINADSADDTLRAEVIWSANPIAARLEGGDISSNMAIANFPVGLPATAQNRLRHSEVTEVFEGHAATRSIDIYPLTASEASSNKTVEIKLETLWLTETQMLLAIKLTDPRWGIVTAGLSQIALNAENSPLFLLPENVRPRLPKKQKKF